MKDSLFKKFMEYGVGSIITLLLGFITSPIITRIISPEQNGKFSMFNTVTNLLMLIVMLGLDQSYVRYYYEEEPCNRGKLLRQCIRAPLITNLFVAVLLIIFYKQISIFIIQEESVFTTILLAINLLISLIFRFAILQIRMKQRGKLYSLLNILMKVLNLVFILLIFYVYKNNYMTLILANIFTNLVIVFTALFIERREWLNKGEGILKTSEREIIKFGLPQVFSMSIIWIFQSVDRIAIKEFSGFNEVGLYSGAMTIISLLNAVQGTFTMFWTPVAFERYSKDPNDKEFFSKINKIVTVVMLLIAIVLISCKDIIVLLLGPKYREAVFIFPYLVFMPIMYTISETTVLGINFKKMPKYHINIAIVSAIVNILGNMILVPKFGAKGAAISTGISYIVFFMVRTYFSNKLYKVNYGIGKFTIATLFVYILATYSSFYKFNTIIFILTFVSLIIILFLYRDILFELKGIIKIKIRKDN